MTSRPPFIVMIRGIWFNTHIMEVVNFSKSGVISLLESSTCIRYIGRVPHLNFAKKVSITMASRGSVLHSIISTVLLRPHVHLLVVCGSVTWTSPSIRLAELTILLSHAKKPLYFLMFVRWSMALIFFEDVDPLILLWRRSLHDPSCSVAFFDSRDALPRGVPCHWEALLWASFAFFAKRSSFFTKCLAFIVKSVAGLITLVTLSSISLRESHLRWLVVISLSS